MAGIIFATYKVSSGLGQRWGRMHKGIDYACPVGTSVQSVTNGTVIFTGYEPSGFGNYIKVKDASGNIHYYGHLSKILVKSGSVVQAGEEIGKSGNTGRSTGPHVHYQVISKTGAVLNPETFLNGVSVSAPVTNSPVADTVSIADNLSVKKISNRILRTGAIAIILLFLLIVAVVGFMKAFGISTNPIKISELKGE